MAVKEWLNEMEMEGGRFRSSEGQLPNLLSSLNPLRKGRKEIEEKLEVILARLEYLVKQKDALGLREGVEEKPSAHKRPTFLVDESGVFGRDGDKEAILELLLTVDAKSNDPHVILIVGMGGVGKNTKVWVCVLEEYDDLKGTKNILRRLV